jgi:hypothetical protein
MAHRSALLLLAASAPLILVTFFLSSELGALLFTLLAVAFPVALIALGASRKGRLGPLTAPLLVLLLILEGSALGMFLLRGRIMEVAWFGGLPLAAALEIYAMWILPLGLVALAYALTFESFNLTESDLRRIRSAAGKENEEG